ncbi:hypothetical protein MIR68_010364 [Amoeboaphelidium protococcarum]|nr:hypothetical protein MIR68_010364 [Amoeboaphelidium protococcarum]
MSQQQYQLKDSHSDGITRVRFNQNSDSLISSSWDGKVKYYQDVSEKPKTFDFQIPVLDVSCTDVETEIIAACLDGGVYKYDFMSGNNVELYQHKDGAKCVEFLSKAHIIISGSWDKTLILYSLKTGGQKIIQLPGKVYSMSLQKHVLVVAMSDRAIWIFDLSCFMTGRSVDSLDDLKPIQKRESSLKHQTRCVCLSPDALCYVTSSIEGRVAVDFIGADSETQSKKYAFRCHRVKADGTETIYPVNALTFHPNYGTFLTGGSDNNVSVWDGAKRKRIKQFQFTNSIASLSFRRDGKQLAIACSYMYEHGDIENQLSDCVIIRRLEDGECMPKKS